MDKEFSNRIKAKTKKQKERQTRDGYEGKIKDALPQNTGNGTHSTMDTPNVTRPSRMTLENGWLSSPLPVYTDFC